MAALLAAGPTQADWINLTGAEATEFADRVEVALAVFVWNLRTCEAQIPDD